jgi:hypothetical protein
MLNYRLQVSPPIELLRGGPDVVLRQSIHPNQLGMKVSVTTVTGAGNLEWNALGSDPA